MLCYTGTMRWLIGIDEAGRGPLAGPVAVGVCVAPDGFDLTPLAGIRDSKKLSEKQREGWYGTLTTLPDIRYAVSMVSAGHIDRHGIQHAIRTTLSHALARLALDPRECTVLLDGGLRAPNEYADQTTIVRGDATEPLISAAAILAKVTRDRYMVGQADIYPAYGFEVHKGYGTAKHREAIRVHGVSPLHRSTFCRNI
jgi:ribonuclease HII